MDEGFGYIASPLKLYGTYRMEASFGIKRFPTTSVFKFLEE